MRIVALDPSLVCSGYAVHDDNDESAITTYTVRPKVRGMERLDLLQGEFLAAVADTDLLVLEGYSFGSRGRSTLNLGELGGVLRLTAWQWDVPYIEVAPGMLKKYATGKGNAPKGAVMAAAIRKLGYEGSDDNEADALWLLDMAMQHYLGGRALTQYQGEVLDRIDWPVIDR